jgi:hypothetical protein
MICCVQAFVFLLLQLSTKSAEIITFNREDTRKMKPYDYDSKKLKKVRGGVIESPPPPAYVDDRGPSQQSWISYNRPLSRTQPSLSTAESQTSKKRGGCHIMCCNGNYIEISTRGGFVLVAIVAIIAAVVIVALVKILPKQ